MANTPSSTSHEVAHDQHTHPGAMQYVVIAAILTIITAAEVAVFYIPALASALTFILVTLSAAKFVLVIMFYMHLKFDSRIFSMVFVAPLILAIGVVFALVFLFKVLPQL